MYDTVSCVMSVCSSVVSRQYIKGSQGSRAFGTCWNGRRDCVFFSDTDSRVDSSFMAAAVMSEELPGSGCSSWWLCADSPAMGSVGLLLSLSFGKSEGAAVPSAVQAPSSSGLLESGKHCRVLLVVLLQYPTSFLAASCRFLRFCAIFSRRACLSASSGR